jgi:preprotein translocase subunit SecG
MLYNLLLGLLIIVSIVLVGAILMQAGQGGGMAATFGGVSSSASTIFGTRQAGNLLTKASWWGGGIFLGLAFILSLMSSQTRTPTSILDQAFPTQTQPAPGAAPIGAPAPATTAPPLGTTKGGDTTKR